MTSRSKLWRPTEQIHQEDGSLPVALSKRAKHTCYLPHPADRGDIPDSQLRNLSFCWSSKRWHESEMEAVDTSTLMNVPVHGGGGSGDGGNRIHSMWHFMAIHGHGHWMVIQWSIWPLKTLTALQLLHLDGLRFTNKRCEEAITGQKLVRSSQIGWGTL